MEAKSIIIRVDGSPEIGLGHIYRGIALAEMLKEDFSVTFIVKSSSTISPIKEAGFHILILPEDINMSKEPEWLIQNFQTDSIIILDGYQFLENYQRILKNKGFKLVYVDDLVEFHMYADLVINHAPGVKPEDYSAESYTKFALGPKYAILRPVFLEATKQKRLIPTIDTAFVCFGGADSNDLTLMSTKILLQIKQIERINIVVGAAYRHTEIYSLQKKIPLINIFQNLTEKELIEVMFKSNLAIASASTILYELCTVKMAILSGYYIENQKNIYYGLIDYKSIYGIGNFRTIKKSTYLKHLNAILSDQNNIVEIMLNNQARVFDHFIRKRLLTIIKSL
jgi:UDP-2,4-diacetamido-2,4,6-trideoxy-beta-L-altropyranose hydrolase